MTPWTVARQHPLSMEFSRPEYWSRLPFPSPGDLPDPGIEPTSLASSALAGRFFTIESLAFLKHQKPSKLCFYMYSFLWLSNIPFGEGNGNPLQYSYLENPMDGGAWWAAVHGVAKSWTRLSNFTFTFHFHALEKETATHSSVLAWRIPGTEEPVGQPSMGSYRVGHD